MRYLPTLVLCLFAAQAWAINPAILACVGNHPASTACDVTQQSETDDGSATWFTLARYDADDYVASQFVYSGTDGKAICAVNATAYFTGSSAHGYQAAIYGNDGSDDPDENNILGTSDELDLNGITGSAPGEQVQFSFSTPTSALTNGSTYHIVFFSDSVDVDNYANFKRDSTGVTELQHSSSDGASWTEDHTDRTLVFALISQ